MAYFPVPKRPEEQENPLWGHASQNVVEPIYQRPDDVPATHSSGVYGPGPNRGFQLRVKYHEEDDYSRNMVDINDESFEAWDSSGSRKGPPSDGPPRPLNWKSWSLWRICFTMAGILWCSFIVLSAITLIIISGMAYFQYQQCANPAFKAQSSYDLSGMETVQIRITSGHVKVIQSDHVTKPTLYVEQSARTEEALNAMKESYKVHDGRHADFSGLSLSKSWSFCQSHHVVLELPSHFRARELIIDVEWGSVIFDKSKNHFEDVSVNVHAGMIEMARTVVRHQLKMNVRSGQIDLVHVLARGEMNVNVLHGDLQMLWIWTPHLTILGDTGNVRLTNVWIQRQGLLNIEVGMGDVELSHVLGGKNHRVQVLSGTVSLAIDPEESYGIFESISESGSTALLSDRDTSLKYQLEVQKDNDGREFRLSIPPLKKKPSRVPTIRREELPLEVEEMVNERDLQVLGKAPALTAIPAWKIQSRSALTVIQVLPGWLKHSPVHFSSLRCFTWRWWKHQLTKWMYSM